MAAWERFIFRRPDLGGLGNHIILDIETTGLLENKDLVVSAGFFDGRIAIIYFLEDPRKEPKFRGFIRDLVRSYWYQGVNVWAYNSKFESRFLRLRNIRDLALYYDGDYWDEFLGERTCCVSRMAKMVYAARAAYDYIKEKEDINIDLDDFFNGYESGGMVPRLYEDYIYRGNPESKKRIIWHNYQDIVLESIILFYIVSYIKDSLNKGKDGKPYYPKMGFF